MKITHYALIVIISFYSFVFCLYIAAACLDHWTRQNQKGETTELSYILFECFIDVLLITEMPLHHREADASQAIRLYYDLVSVCGAVEQVETLQGSIALVKHSMIQGFFIHVNVDIYLKGNGI